MIKLYEYNYGSHTLTDISDDILGISNIEWKREWYGNAVLMHPKIEVNESLNISKNDIIVMEMDVNALENRYPIILYVRKKINETTKHTISLETSELLYKLSEYYVGDISESDWSGYSPQLSEYKGYTNPNNWDEYYISIKFLIEVFLKKAGIIENINGHYFFEPKEVDSFYLREHNCNSNDDKRPVKYGYLGFNFRQMQHNIGRNKDNTIEEGSTLLDLFLMIMKSTGLGWRYEVNTANYVDFRIYKYGNVPLIPDDNVYNLSIRDKEQYNYLISKNKYLTSVKGYYAGISSTDEKETYKYPNNSIAKKK